MRKGGRKREREKEGRRKERRKKGQKKGKKEIKEERKEKEGGKGKKKEGRRERGWRGSEREKYFCQREGLIDKQNSHQYIIILRTKYNTKTKLTKGKLDLIIFYYKKFL